MTPFGTPSDFDERSWAERSVNEMTGDVKRFVFWVFVGGFAGVAAAVAIVVWMVG